MESLFLPKPNRICIVCEPSGQEVPITLRSQVTVIVTKVTWGGSEKVAYAF